MADAHAVFEAGRHDFAGLRLGRTEQEGRAWAGCFSLDGEDGRWIKLWVKGDLSMRYRGLDMTELR